jgi:hypothetical protein
MARRSGPAEACAVLLDHFVSRRRYSGQPASARKLRNFEPKAIAEVSVSGGNEYHFHLGCDAV